MRRTNFSSYFSLFLAAGLALTFWCPFVRGADPVPVAFPTNRYDLVRNRSPFATATAEAPPMAPQASFAANWFVGGVARIGDNNYVTIKSRDLSSQFSLFAGDEVQGVTLVSVTWSDMVGKSTVILRKGAETAKLEFNEAEVRAAPAAQAATGTPVAGAKPPMGSPPLRNLGRPPLPLPRLPAQGATPTNSEIRRRPQIIQPPQ